MHMRRMVFKVIICSVDFSFLPYDIELVLGFSTFYPIGSEIIRLCSVWSHSLIDTNPSAVELSVATVVLGCGCPISSKAIRKGMAAFQL